MDPTVEFYDATAETYFKEWRDNRLLMPWLKDLVVRLPASRCILDLGCGPGCETRRLVDLGATVTGIDLSESALAIARAHVPEATFLEMDARNLELATASFDAVVEAALLFHFDDTAQDRILSSIKAALRPSGYFLSVYMTGSFRGTQKRTFNDREFERTVNLKSMEAWTAQVCSSGFGIAVPAQPVLGPFSAALFQKVG